MSRRKWLISVVLVVTAFVASGCWDRVELEDVAWVQAIGFDKGPVEGFLSTTMEIGVPRNLRGGGGPTPSAGPSPHYVTITVVSRTALEALDLAALNLGRRVSLVHAQLFLFGEELARSDLRALAQAVDRFREIRGNTPVAIAHGHAEDLLRVNISPLEVSPSRFLMTIMQQHEQTGLFEKATFVRDFVNLVESSSSSPRCPVLSLASDYKPSTSQTGGGAAGSTGAEDPAESFPSSPQVGERVEPKVDLGQFTPSQNTTDLEGWQVPIAGGGPVVMMGLALFQGGKMVGTLTGEETRTVLMARNDFENGSFAVPDPTAPGKPDLSLGVGASGAKSKVKVTRDGDQVGIKVDIEVTVTYLSPKTQTDFSDPRMTPVAETAIEDYLKSILDRTIGKCQAAGSDVFEFGDRVKATFWTWPEFEAFAWLSKFPTAKIETAFHAKIVRYGLDLGPLVVPPSENARRQ